MCTFGLLWGSDLWKDRTDDCTLDSPRFGKIVVRPGPSRPRPSPARGIRETSIAMEGFKRVDVQLVSSELLPLYVSYPMHRYISRCRMQKSGPVGVVGYLVIPKFRNSIPAIIRHDTYRPRSPIPSDTPTRRHGSCEPAEGKSDQRLDCRRTRDILLNAQRPAS